MRNVLDSFNIRLRVTDEHGSNAEWVDTSPQSAFGDSQGSVCLIHFIDDIVLFVNGKQVCEAFEDESREVWETVYGAANNLATILGTEYFEIEVEPKSYDDPEFDEFMMDWNFNDIGLIVFEGRHPLETGVV